MMKRSLRPHIGAFLAVMLAVTGQSMAVARGMPNAAGEIILCTGAGAVSILVDENGQPAEKLHICPDFALTLFAQAAEQPALPARPLGAVEKLAPALQSFKASARDIEPSARGPPVLA